MKNNNAIPWGRVGVIGMLALLIAGVWARVNPVDELRELDFSEARALSPLWIDARGKAEKRLPEAVKMRAENYEGDFGALAAVWDGTQSLVVFCESKGCGTSRMIAERLRRDLGFKNVFVLRGGWDSVPQEDTQ